MSDGWTSGPLDVLLPIMERRIAACKDKGFDAVEPDNVDGYANASGFPLSAPPTRSPTTMRSRGSPTGTGSGSP